MSDERNDGGPAFPTDHWESKVSEKVCDDLFEYRGPHPGMTLRDYFAATAPPLPAPILARYLEIMASLNPDMWADGVMTWNGGNLAALAKQEARWRAAYADAMLEARGKKVS